MLTTGTGLFHILRSLGDDAEYLYDFTIGYSGHDATQFAYDKFPLEILIDGEGPEAIHIHVDRFKIADIPGVGRSPYNPEENTPKEFENWLYDRFKAKSILLQGFYATGRFPEYSLTGEGLRQHIPIDPQVQDWVSVAAIFFSALFSFRLL